MTSEELFFAACWTRTSGNDGLDLPDSCSSHSALLLQHERPMGQAVGKFE